MITTSRINPKHSNTLTCISMTQSYYSFSKTVGHTSHRPALWQILSGLCAQTLYSILQGWRVQSHNLYDIYICMFMLKYILTFFFFWYSIIMVPIRSFSWKKQTNEVVHVEIVKQHVIRCIHVWSSVGCCTIWLEGRTARFCIISSISSNFLAIAWTSLCSSLYSAYWSLNTALYWSLSSSVRMLGYLLWKKDRAQHIFLGHWLDSHSSWTQVS